MSYSCEICKTEYKNKRNFNDHLKSQRHTNQLHALDSIQVYSCNCGKKYNHSSALYRHRKICQTYLKFKHTGNMTEASLCEEIETQKQQIVELQNQITELTNNQNRNQNQNRNRGGNRISNSTINNNTTNNNNITININPFGQENLDFITNERYLYCLNKVYKSTQALAEIIYSHPENKNITIPNKKEPYASIKTETGEELTLLNDALDTMETFCYTVLEEKFTDPAFRNKMTSFRRGAFQGYMDAYANDGSGKVRKTIRKHLKLMLLNMRMER